MRKSHKTTKKTGTVKSLTNKAVAQITEFKDQVMTFKTVLLSSLKFNPLNPVIRTDETHHAFKALVNNIRKNGLLTPIVIANDNMIIDGNRRTRALQLLGVKKVPVIMHNSTSHVTFDNLFVACNEDTMKINACQELERYLNGAKVKTATYHAIKNVEEVGGRKTLRQIVNVNKSPVTFSIALSQVRSYTGRKDSAFLRQALAWMLSTGSAYRLKAAINEFTPVPRIISAIENKTPLVQKWHKSFKPLTEGENLTTIPVKSLQVNGQNEIVGYTTT